MASQPGCDVPSLKEAIEVSPFMLHCGTPATEANLPLATEAFVQEVILAVIDAGSRVLQSSVIRRKVSLDTPYSKDTNTAINHHRIS